MSAHSGPALLVYLIRHGETEENRQGIVQGQLETQLNATGREQTRRLAVALKDHRFDHAFCSTLGRAIETTDAVIAYHPGLKLHVQPGLMERNLGELQGKKRANAANPPSVEPMDAYVARILAWWEGNVLPLMPSVPVVVNVLVIGHGSYLANLIKALGCDVAGRGKAYNTGITSVRVEKDGGVVRVVRYSDVKHLEGMREGVVEKNVDDVDAKAGRTG